MLTAAWLIIGICVGFFAGAFTAFLIGKRFMKRESRKLYERWRRKEVSKKRDWLLHLTHDLRHPLYLIQTFTWTYLDKIKRRKTTAEELKKSSKKMAKTLHEEANKAISLLDKATKEEK